MDFIDNYIILGMSKTAGEKEIKSACRKLARKHHPDLNHGDMTTLQKSASKIIDKDAYVVENPDRKDNYMVDKAAYAAVLLDFLKD